LSLSSIKQSWADHTCSGERVSINNVHLQFKLQRTQISLAKNRYPAYIKRVYILFFNNVASVKCVHVLVLSLSGVFSQTKGLPFIMSSSIAVSAVHIFFTSIYSLNIVPFGSFIQLYVDLYFWTGLNIVWKREHLRLTVIFVQNELGASTMPSTVKTWTRKPNGKCDICSGWIVERVWKCRTYIGGHNGRFWRPDLDPTEPLRELDRACCSYSRLHHLPLGLVCVEYGNPLSSSWILDTYAQ
jgi:hypothetical protein